MSGSGSSDSSSYVPLIRRRKSGNLQMTSKEADVGTSMTGRSDEVGPPVGMRNENVVTLVERPGRALPRFAVPRCINEVNSSDDASVENVEVVSTAGRQSWRRPVLNRGPEYLRCDNDSDIYSSWCTEESIGVMKSHCKLSDQIEIRIPGVKERPWDCPRDFLCLYESFFLEGCLWFPLPKLLVTYCFERGLAISQLTLESICHIVGLLVLGSEAGIEVCCRLLEEISLIERIKGRVFHVSAKSKFNLIAHDQGNKLRGWQRFYFFAKRSDLTVSSSRPIYRRWAGSYGS